MPEPLEYGTQPRRSRVLAHVAISFAVQSVVSAAVVTYRGLLNNGRVPIPWIVMTIVYIAVITLVAFRRTRTGGLAVLIILDAFFASSLL